MGVSWFIPVLTFIVDSSVETTGGAKLLFSLWAVVTRATTRRKKKRVAEALCRETEDKVFLVTMTVMVEEVGLISSQAMQIN